MYTQETKSETTTGETGPSDIPGLSGEVKYNKSNQTSSNTSKTSNIKGYNFQFKRNNPNIEERRKECQKIRNQFPNKIPIICEKDPKSKVQDIDKTKFLVPDDLTVSQFNMMIRKRIQLNQESAFYLWANGKVSITGDSLLSDIYKKFKDPEDGFLYIAYAGELTWGNK